MDARGPADLPTLVVDFLNTLDIETRLDLLDRPVAWSSWASDRGLVAGDPGLARAARDSLRDLIAGGPADLPAVSLTIAGPARRGAMRLVPAEPEDATSAVLAAVVTLAAREGLDRFKLCHADTCREAFHDRSKNRSRTWCEMAVCGNRAKSRTHRSRA